MKTSQKKEWKQTTLTGTDSLTPGTHKEKDGKSDKDSGQVIITEKFMICGTYKQGIEWLKLATDVVNNMSE